MKKYELTYYECYSKTYCVEAETADEAKEKLKDMMLEGMVDGPEECYDSGFSCCVEKED